MVMAMAMPMAMHGVPDEDVQLAEQARKLRRMAEEAARDEGLYQQLAFDGMVREALDVATRVRAVRERLERRIADARRSQAERAEAARLLLALERTVDDACQQLRTIGTRGRD